ncbi:hypothetical protein Mame01_29010 [Microbispora amethystogenes]|nr:hypothetical protein Mame01_29010 [Microbispora amethystogenes]
MRRARPGPRGERPRPVTAWRRARARHKPCGRGGARRTYRSRVRMFLAWLADYTATYTADPLTDRQARDWAVRD